MARPRVVNPAVPAAGPAAVPTGVSVPRAPAHQVARKAIAYWSVRAAVVWVVVAAAEVLFLALPGSPAAVWIPIAGISLVLAVLHVLVMPRIRYRIHRWEQTDTAFYTQSGWLVVERRLAPMSRVQTVDVERGAVENLFGLATLTVTTASAAGPLKVPALARATADRLAEELGAAAGDTRDDAT